MLKQPGWLKWDNQKWYDENPNLLNDTIAHIKEWADSVPSGTYATPEEVFNFKGYPTGLPLGTWMDPFLPENGGIEGISVVVQYGPLLPLSPCHKQMIVKNFSHGYPEKPVASKASAMSYKKLLEMLHIGYLD